MGIFWDLEQPARQRQAGRIGGLLGESITSEMSGTSMEFDEFGNPIDVRQQVPQVYGRQGTGFLGSDRGVMAQAQLNAGLQTVGGLDSSQASQMMAPLTQQSNNNALMQKAMMMEQLKQSNISKLRKGDFKDQKDRLGALNQVGDDYKKDIAPFRQSIQYYNDSASLATKAGGVDSMTGTDDFIIMRNLLKQSLPNESVMGDDLATLKLAAGGMPGWASALIAQLSGGGMQGIQARKEILTTMKNLAETRSGERDEIRQQYIDLTDSVDGLDSSNFMLEAQNIKPLPFGKKEPHSQPTASDGKSYTPEEIKAELRRRQMTGVVNRGN